MPTLPNKRLEEALAGQERAIRAAFLDAIRQHGNGINLAALTAALDRGDIQAAVEIARITPAMLYGLDAAIVAAYAEGANTIVRAAPSFAARFGFDGRAVRAERWALDNAANLVREIAADQVTALREATQQQLEAGVNPRKAAINIAGKVNRVTGNREGGIVGLRSDQVRTVQNVRDDLENLNPRYFTRKLRNKSLDRLVRKAIRDGKPLSQVDIDRIAARYADKALKYRADVIARTESINALRAGRDEGIRQAIEQGAINGNATQKVWDSSGDARVRRDHATMDGQSVAMNEAFVAPDGSRLNYPGDSSLGASAKQTVQCRCFTNYRVDWLRG
jgi:hypothetical protein